MEWVGVLRLVCLNMGLGREKMEEQRKTFQIPKSVRRQKKQRKKISTLVTEAQYSEPKEPVFIPRMFALHQINRRTKSASNLLKCKN